MDYSIKMDTGKLWTLLKQTYNKSNFHGPNNAI
jgi:hypothetical protein